MFFVELFVSNNTCHVRSVMADMVIAVMVENVVGRCTETRMASAAANINHRSQRSRTVPNESNNKC